jgi:hypothetical protein
MIPYAQTYTATIRARAMKAVTCEECRLEYLYMVERTGTSEGTSLLFWITRGLRLGLNAGRSPRPSRN